jgi:DNA-binding response OmpR family regulator
MAFDTPYAARIGYRATFCFVRRTKAYSSAKTFLDEHDGSTPGCVVLDLLMPEFDGLDVQEALTGQGINRPVIFLTGKATRAEQRPGNEGGRDRLPH